MRLGCCVPARSVAARAPSPSPPPQCPAGGAFAVAFLQGPWQLDASFSFFAVLLGNYVGYSLSLEQGGRLFTITYIIGRGTGSWGFRV